MVNVDGVPASLIGGRHYGSSRRRGRCGPARDAAPSLAEAGYLSVAVLLDASPATLELFRQHAYAFVTDSRATWDYDEAAAQMTATYAYGRS